MKENETFLTRRKLCICTYIAQKVVIIVENDERY